jgi:hypothetical protein
VRECLVIDVNADLAAGNRPTEQITLETVAAGRLGQGEFLGNSAIGAGDRNIMVMSLSANADRVAAAYPLLRDA